jgi:hypothetical protein
MNASNGSGNRYLRVDAGQSYTVALKSLTPREVHGNFGPQLQWHLADGKSLYTPVYLGEHISRLGLKPYQLDLIQKIEELQSANAGKSQPANEPGEERQNKEGEKS